MFRWLDDNWTKILLLTVSFFVMYTLITKQLEADKLNRDLNQIMKTANISPDFKPFTQYENYKAVLK